MRIAVQLNDFMNEFGFSADKVAEKLVVTKKTVQRWLRGGHPQYWNLRRLSIWMSGLGIFLVSEWGWDAELARFRKNKITINKWGEV